MQRKTRLSGITLMMGFAMGFFVHSLMGGPLFACKQTLPAVEMKPAKVLHSVAVPVAENKPSAAPAPPKQQVDREPERPAPVQAAVVLNDDNPDGFERVETVPPLKGPRFMGPIGPPGTVLATAGPNKGKPCVDCVFVAVTMCCKSWNVTQILIHQLLQSEDNIHVVVFDDRSKDDGPQQASALGLHVVQPTNPNGIGLTAMMNVAWRYFYHRPELDTMHLLNNDLQIATKNTFAKLNRCMHNIEVCACVRVYSISLAACLLCECVSSVCFWYALVSFSC